MNRMTVLWVDDTPAEIAYAVRTVMSTGLFDVKQYTTYASIDKNAVTVADLLVLDIMMGMHSKPFVDFVDSIAGQKPFICYSVLTGKTWIDLPTGAGDIRSWVLAKGGMGAFTKTPDGKDQSYNVDEARAQLANDLIERMLIFFWCRATLVTGNSES